MYGLNDRTSEPRDIPVMPYSLPSNADQHFYQQLPHLHIAGQSLVKSRADTMPTAEVTVGAVLDAPQMTVCTQGRDVTRVSDVTTGQ